MNAPRARVYAYSRNPLNPSWAALMECIASANDAVWVLPDRPFHSARRAFGTLPESRSSVAFKALPSRLDAEGPDTVVLTSGLGSLETLEAARLKRRHRFRLVCLSNPRVPFAHRPDREEAERRRHAFQKIDRILAAGEYAGRVLMREFIPGNRISVWSPGLAFPPAGAGDVAALRERYGFRETDRIIGWFGPHDRDGAMFAALEAFRALVEEFPDARVAFVGWGRGGRDFREWSGLLGLQQDERVRFFQLERTDGEAVARLCEMLVFSPAALEDPLFAMSPWAWRALGSGKPVLVPDTRWLQGIPLEGAHLYPAGRLDRAVEPLRFFFLHADAERDAREALAERVRTLLDLRACSEALGALCREITVRREPVHDQHKPAPRLSVLIPCYNRAHLIHRALDSVRGQRGVNRADMEVLVLDDGSEDGLAQVLERYPEAVHVRLPHTGRVGRVRSEGLRRASGEIVAYLDSDDRWEPDHLRRILRAFHRDPDLGLVVTGFRFEVLSVGTDGRIKAVRQKPYHHRNDIITDAVAHRRICSDTVGDFPDFQFAEDYFYWKRIMDLFPFRRLRARTAVYSFTEKGNNLSYRHSAVLRGRYSGSSS